MAVPKNTEFTNKDYDVEASTPLGAPWALSRSSLITKLLSIHLCCLQNWMN
jgi:hypothetical protein